MYRTFVLFFSIFLKSKIVLNNGINICTKFTRYNILANSSITILYPNFTASILMSYPSANVSSSGVDGVFYLYKVRDSIPPRLREILAASNLSFSANGNYLMITNNSEYNAVVEIIGRNITSQVE